MFPQMAAATILKFYLQNTFLELQKNTKESQRTGEQRNGLLATYSSLAVCCFCSFRSQMVARYSRLAEVGQWVEYRFKIDVVVVVLSHHVSCLHNFMAINIFIQSKYSIRVVRTMNLRYLGDSDLHRNGRMQPGCPLYQSFSKAWLSLN